MAITRNHLIDWLRGCYRPDRMADLVYRRFVARTPPPTLHDWASEWGLSGSRAGEMQQEAIRHLGVAAYKGRRVKAADLAQAPRLLEAVTEMSVDDWHARGCPEYGDGRRRIAKATAVPVSTEQEAASSAHTGHSQPTIAKAGRAATSSRRAIASALLAYDPDKDLPADRLWQPAGHAAADELIRSDPFALLIAMICNYQIPVERVWRAPYELKQRLGHLDPRRMVRDPDAVRSAFARPPALHRFVNNVSGWIVVAAQRVVTQYKGDAVNIWNDVPSAADLQDRLAEFPGISQKKAAVLVRNLRYNLGVPMSSLEGIDIAYDIHVRRVFLRTGLAVRDDQSHMLAVARELAPDRPCHLDYPAWWIGRYWCHSTGPNCGACPIRMICPKLLARAASVQ